MARRPNAIDGVTFIQQDITEEIHFNEKVDFIIHAATPVVNDKSTTDELLSIIVNGTQRIANFAVKIGCTRFLHVSSGGAYGTQPSEMEKIEEDYFDKATVFDSHNPYGTGKRISELVVSQILSKSNVEFVIARCFAFSGKHLAYDQHFAIGNFVRDALDSGIIHVKGDGTAVRSYMDSSDLTPWLLTILLKGKNKEAYNMGSDEAVSIKELASRVADLTQSKVAIQNQSGNNLKTNRYIPSIEKAKKELGLSLTMDLNTSIKNMIEFYRNSK